MKIKNILFAALFILGIAAPLTTVAAAPTVSAVGACSDRGFLGMPTWYRGVYQNVGGECRIVGPSEISDGDLGVYITIIVLNAIEIGLVIIGYLALFFIIYGAFQYLTGGSNPGQIEKAGKSILNAVIGLVISIGSIGLVNLVFGSLVTTEETVSFGAGGEVTIPTPEGADLVGGILDLAYYILGAVAVLMIIIAALKYVTSAGDPQKAQSARKTITYSVVGLIVAILASFITNFVIGAL